MLGTGIVGGAAHADYSPGRSCAGNANSVGISLYCINPNTDFVYRTLMERFPGLDWHACVDHEIPPGMRPPADNREREGEYWLQACLEGVNFDTATGGRDIEVTLGFHFVGEGEEAYTEDDLNALEQAVWEQVDRRNYPVPFMTAFPTHIPRVNVPTFFHFKWMDLGGDQPTEKASPEVRLSLGDTTLTARSAKIIVDPQVDGVEPVECEGNPPKYDLDKPPDAQQQENQCFVTFEHSSAAAEELTTSEVPLPDLGDEYPVPVYLLKVTVVWEATMMDGGVERDLGQNEFVAYQAIPVTEILGNAGLGF